MLVPRLVLLVGLEPYAAVELVVLVDDIDDALQGFLRPSIRGSVEDDVLVNGAFQPAIVVDGQAWRVLRHAAFRFRTEDNRVLWSQHIADQVFIVEVQQLQQLQARGPGLVVAPLRQLDQMVWHILVDSLVLVGLALSMPHENDQPRLVLIQGHGELVVMAGARTRSLIVRIHYWFVGTFRSSNVCIAGVC